MDFNQLNRDVIRRQAGGKTIWQPRIICWYQDRAYRGEPLPPGYEGCSVTQLYEQLGCSNRLYDFGACLESHYDSSITFHNEEIAPLTWRHQIDTPVGSVYEIVKGNQENPGQMPEKWYIETEEDLKVFTYIEEGTTYSFNMDTYDRIFAEQGHLGLPSMNLPRTNIQHLFVVLAGVTNTIYLMADYPDTMDAYFKALSKSQEGMLKAVGDSPLEWVNYGDNLHCKILPPDLYKKYILPEYQKRSDILHKKDKFIISHWDGDVKDILQFARVSGLDGIEAITPLPQGDVTLEETKKALGDDIFLVDGLCSIYFNDTYPVEKLKEQTRDILNLFEGQLVLGISDEFPSDGKLERIRLVGEMVEEFNSKHA